MVRHIVFWKHDEKFTEQEKINNANTIKQSLEALKNTIPGIISIKVITDPLPSSSGDVILDSLFSNEDALKVYQGHPDHLKAASFVRSVMTDRKCIDYHEA
jgi:hypothetical protein